MSPVDELDELLRSLQTLKPPGVTKSKIDLITNICNTNVQNESLLIQKIFTHFKKTAPTHKLGVLYVVDSVTRQWVEKARVAGQDITAGTAADGTYAAGINRMTELLPMLMNEILNVAPDNQKDKIKKLVEIWERGSTFPPHILTEIKRKLNPAPQSFVASSTPPGDPPQQLLSSLGLQSAEVQPKPSAPAAPIASDAGAILAALANMGKQTQEVPKPPAPAPPPSQEQFQYQAPLSAYAPPVTSHPPPAAQFALQQLLGVQSAPTPPAAPLVPQVPAAQPAAAPASTTALQLQLLQALAQQQGQLPPEQLARVVAALGLAPQAGGGALQAPAPVIPQSGHHSVIGYGESGRNGQPGYDEDPRRRHAGHENDRYRQRSRSPDYRRGGASPPHRRDSPTYGVYDPSTAAVGSSRSVEGNQRGRGRGRGSRYDYRQRSPPPEDRQRVGSPGSVRPPQPKWIDFDRSMPPGTFRVLSRTLFVGGVAASEPEVRSIFARFGIVQSCIVNHDKRHAFVKMFTRKDAVAAREGMEMETDPEVLSKVRSTRWGVGFGPRECSDYNTGISTIPMDRLTDADRKWILSAHFGGTGGVALEPGMVVEEPDIEIGQGVSSKAISRRVGPDYTSRGRGRGGYEHGSSRPSRGRPDRDRGNQRPQSPRPEPNNVGVPPAVPGFGFQLPGV